MYEVIHSISKRIYSVFMLTRKVEIWKEANLQFRPVCLFLFDFLIWRQAEKNRKGALHFVSIYSALSRVMFLNNFSTVDDHSYNVWLSLHSEGQCLTWIQEFHNLSVLQKPPKWSHNDPVPSLQSLNLWEPLVSSQMWTMATTCRRWRLRVLGSLGEIWVGLFK